MMNEIKVKTRELKLNFQQLRVQCKNKVASYQRHNNFQIYRTDCKDVKNCALGCFKEYFMVLANIWLYDNHIISLPTSPNGEHIIYKWLRISTSLKEDSCSVSSICTTCPIFGLFGAFGSTQRKATSKVFFNARDAGFSGSFGSKIPSGFRFVTIILSQSTRFTC